MWQTFKHQALRLRGYYLVVISDKFETISGQCWNHFGIIYTACWAHVRAIVGSSFNICALVWGNVGSFGNHLDAHSRQVWNCFKASGLPNTIQNSKTYANTHLFWMPLKNHQGHMGNMCRRPRGDCCRRGAGTHRTIVRRAGVYRSHPILGAIYPVPRLAETALRRTPLGSSRRRQETV